MKYAAIDIGTNTILLLVADVAEDVFDEVIDLSMIVRLGEDLARSGRLKDEAVSRTVKGLRRYLDIASSNSVEKIFCVGTAALREARNGKEFVALVKDTFGLDIEIISGRDEAYYTYLSVRNDAAIQHSSMTIIDIGGGSTEIINSADNKFAGYVSLPMGSVVLTDSFITHDPPGAGELETVALYIRKNLAGVGYSPGSTLVGTGGTVTNIAALIIGIPRYDKSRVHGYLIHIEDLKRLIASLTRLTSPMRRRITGMEAGREDIIVQGAKILEEVMIDGGFDSCIVSAAGVRYGLLYQKCPDVSLPGLLV